MIPRSSGQQIDPKRPGGVYVTPEGDDVTGETRSALLIDAKPHGPHGSVLMEVSDDLAVLPKTGKCVVTNMFRKSSGGRPMWEWLKGKTSLGLVKDNQASKPGKPVYVEAIVSVEVGKDHFYALRLESAVPVQLTTYSKRKSEPRLRPTMRGELELGSIVGSIETVGKKGKKHALYDVIRVVPSRIKNRARCESKADKIQ